MLHEMWVGVFSARGAAAGRARARRPGEGEGSRGRRSDAWVDYSRDFRGLANTHVCQPGVATVEAKASWERSPLGLARSALANWNRTAPSQLWLSSYFRSRGREPSDNARRLRLLRSELLARLA